MATVTDTFDFSAARTFLDRKYADKKTANLRLWEKARQDMENIVEMIKKKYSPECIYIWGSLLNKERFNETSDIDIAVKGIKNADEFFALFGDADDMTDFPLDLIELEKTHPLHVESIKRKGKLIYQLERGRTQKEK